MSNLKEELQKLHYKLDASHESLNVLQHALILEKEKQVGYQKFLIGKEDDYDDETLLKGLTSIGNNIETINNAITHDKEQAKILEKEIIETELLMRIGGERNGSQK